jgi:hypothetical protein
MPRDAPRAFPERRHRPHRRSGECGWRSAISGSASYGAGRLHGARRRLRNSSVESIESIARLSNPARGYRAQSGITIFSACFCFKTTRQRRKRTNTHWLLKHIPTSCHCVSQTPRQGGGPQAIVRGDASREKLPTSHRSPPGDLVSCFGVVSLSSSTSAGSDVVRPIEPRNPMRSGRTWRSPVAVRLLRRLASWLCSDGAGSCGGSWCRRCASR